ncbi:MAG: N-acetylglucosamine-specific PTS transporter subunit IIBC [Proteobacteria bacterium]|nr:N-acetylglucosamine-specific PTS transporter subunit IIBC [Pseudomonadota bacterium]
MNILGYLQKIGRALMVPVATLPAAAILMGIGYWIDPEWGANSTLAAFLLKAGGAILSNMAILFAVGIAYGMSKDKDGSAALSGLVGFYVLTTLLSPEAMSLIQGIPKDQVPKAFEKISNPFVGILVGVITSELYNRFSGIELHKALAFFSGRRFVPIVTSIAMLVLAFPLMYIWPVVFGGLVNFGESIMGMGPLGAGIYAFFNRLLIPVGLHHALNAVFWFDVAGINDIPNFLGGAKSLAEGKAVLGVTGMYQAGFFPIMMFGLPGAALAMYHAAKPQNKVRVASLMIAAAFSAFFTGVTEPLEFAFMFVAPALYVLHAVLTGISVYIAASMQWIAGFGFSAGLVDLVLSTKNPLAKNIPMLIAQGFAFFAIYYFSFRFAIKTFNFKTPGREDDEAAAESADASPVSTDTDSLAHAYLDLIGGGANVVAIDACITRLRLTLNDTAGVDEAAAKRLGASGVIKLNKQNIQIIVGPKAELIATRMTQLLASGKGISAAIPAAAVVNAAVAPVVAPAKKVSGDLQLLAPMSGEVVALIEVPDAAFSSKAVGEGLAIRPTGKLVVAPVDGVIAKIFNTNHAFALIADNGAELIVHIGLDTVKLGGKGFTRLLEQGSRVKAGDAVLELDLEYLAANAVSIISPVVLSNVEQFDSVVGFATGHVEAGKTVLYTIKAK